MPLPLIPIAIAAGSALASHFGKKKAKNNYNAAELSGINQQNEAKQKAIVGGLRNNLTPLSAEYESKRRMLGNEVQGSTEGLIDRYGADLNAVNTADANARNAANIGVREQAFRGVPEMQRAIRESLGGSGLSGSGAARSSIAQPIIEANREARDFANQNEASRLAAMSGRTEKLADTGLNLRGSALSSKLGLDEGTINYLQEIGRGDLIDEANSLLGIEEQAGANRLAISQGRATAQNAVDAANASRRGNLISGLSQAGGAAVGGMFGGAQGAGLGAQIGGSFGQMANGSPVSFDPTLLYAMSQRNPMRRTAIVNGLQTPVRPY